ncbi:MAG: DNA polymerase III subunit [Myxococcota bacterium]
MTFGDTTAIRAELARARANGHVHGAYLFEGAPGTGKSETALWFARLLLCKRVAADAAEPCGACHDCHLLAPREGQADALPSHPDLHWVLADGAQIKIEAVRELRAALSLVANERGRRVALIPEAEKLRAAPANALLKTLEEPPPGAVLILVTSSANALPPTLRSRTLRVRFTPWAEPAVRSALEADGVPADDAALASALGGASPRAAREWADASLEEAREMHAFLSGIGGVGATEILDFAETFRRPGEAGRERARLFLEVETAFARSRAEEAIGSGDGRAVERWLRVFEAASKARSELVRRNLNPQLVVEGLLLELRASV